MPLLLDTSVAVELLRGAPEALERAEHSDALYLSVISHLELEAGVYRDSDLAAIFRTRLDGLLAQLEELDFTQSDVAAYASIIAAKGFSRRVMVDRMIAATAINHGLTLATLNPKDFRNIRGLVVEDWSA